jgi:CRP-like cAMP-binding protein
MQNNDGGAAMSIESIKRELADADLFLDWDDLLLELVASIATERRYSLHDLIFDENSDSGELYVIAEGAVEIQINPGIVGSGLQTTRQTIAVLRRGQNFGEVSLLDEGRRSAAAISVHNGTRLIILPREKLMLMCENVPRLGYHLMRSLAADLAMKIRSTDHEIRAHLTWVPTTRFEP